MTEQQTQTLPMPPVTNQEPMQTPPAQPVQTSPAQPVQAPMAPIPMVASPAPSQPSTIASAALTGNAASSTFTASPDDGDAHQAIIAQQQAQIEALMGQNAALNAQVVQFIQGGAQLSSQSGQQGQPQAQQMPPQVAQMLQMGAQPDPLGSFNPPSLTTAQDMSLESLASEIGKDRSHNG